MNTIKLPCYDIEITLGDPDPERPGAFLGGNLTSSLKEDCRYCGQKNCNYDCDESQAGGFDGEDNDDAENRALYNQAIEMLHSLVLAHACSGIDVASFAYLEGIEVAVIALVNSE